MKRTLYVLSGLLLTGLTGLTGLAFLPRHTPDEITVSLIFATLLVVGLGILGIILLFFLLVFPHELGHYFAAKKFGFRVLFIEVMGFRLWFLDPGFTLRFVTTRNFLGMVYFGKPEANINEIRWTLAAGPIANLFCALLLIALYIAFGNLGVLNLMIWGHLVLFTTNILPVGKIRDGARIYQSFRNPRELIDMFNLVYSSMYMQRLRPRKWAPESLVLTGEPIHDVACELYHTWRHMDLGEVAEAETPMRNALKIVIDNNLKYEPAASVCAEAAIYFSRYNLDLEIAKQAINHSQSIKLTPNQVYLVNGATAWLDFNKNQALGWWKKSNDLFLSDVLFEDYRDYGRDWLLRLRTEDMVFETDRLFARPWTLDDVEAAFDIYRKPEVNRYLGRNPKSLESIEEAKEMLERWVANQAKRPVGQGTWALVRKEDEKIIGTIMCKSLPNGDLEPSGEIEIGWHLDPSAWGFGYATEAGLAVAEYGFRMDPNLPRVLAVVYPENTASQNVALKVGMTHLGVSSDYYGIEMELFELKRPETNRAK